MNCTLKWPNVMCVCVRREADGKYNPQKCCLHFLIKYERKCSVVDDLLFAKREEKEFYFQHVFWSIFTKVEWKKSKIFGKSSRKEISEKVINFILDDRNNFFKTFFSFPVLNGRIWEICRIVWNIFSSSEILDDDV